MKFACGRCWDYDCNCTPKEIEEYEAELKQNGIQRRMEEVSSIVEEYKQYLQTTKCYAETISLSAWVRSKR